MPEQMSFISGRWPKSKQPKRAEVLAFVESVMPWDELLSVLRPHYEADCRQTGRRGYSLKMMFRCWLVAHLWGLSDEGVENAILDSLVIAKFVGTDPWSPRPPSASTIRSFRHVVERADRAAWLKSDMQDLPPIGHCINEAFANAGVEWRPGSIVEPVLRRIPAHRRIA